MTNKSKAALSLIAAALIFWFMPLLPYGDVIVRPFQLLSTYIHELGHGLGALVQGGKFLELKIYANGSGLAPVSHLQPGWGIALVAASGLLAPAVAGGLFILAGRSDRIASFVFIGFALLMIISCAFWIRTLFGFTLIGGLGTFFMYLGIKSGRSLLQVLVQLFAIHMLVDTLTDTMRYLFKGSVIVAEQVRHSDTELIANSLGGSHWMWGGLIAFTSVAIFYICFRAAYASNF